MSPIAIPLIGVKLFATWGAFFLAMAQSAVITVGMWGVLKLTSWLRSRSRPEREAPKYTIRGAIVPARWILGRRRVPGVLCFFQRAGREAYLVLAVAEGRLDAIEGIWVNGKNVELAPFKILTDGGRLIDALATDPHANKISFFQYFDADGMGGAQFRAMVAGPNAVTVPLPDGTTRVVPRPYSPQPIDPTDHTFIDPDGIGRYEFDPYVNDGSDRGPADDSPGYVAEASSMSWTAAHKLNGISWVGVRLTQPPWKRASERFWTGPPNIEFLIKGLKFTWPGQSSPSWTENVAAIRYWWETVRRGHPAEAIDTNHFNLAYQLCGESVTIPEADVPAGYDDFPRTAIRYAANGYLTSADDPDGIEQQLDASWAGHAVEIGGVLRFSPGMDRTPEFVILPGDLAEPAIIHPWPALQQRVNAVKARLLQSAVHDYQPLSLREFKDQSAIMKDGRKFLASVPLEFQTDPLSAGRLEAILLRESQERMRLRLRLKPGDPSSAQSPLRMVPLSVCLVQLPKYGLNYSRFYVESTVIRDDMTVDVSLREDLTGTYVTSVVVPELRARHYEFPPVSQAPAVVGLVLSARSEVNLDGAHLTYMTIAWVEAAARVTEIRWREKASGGEAVRAWNHWESLGERTRVVVTSGQTYEVEARHISRESIGGEWTRTELAIVGDLTSPGAPVLNDVDFRPRGFIAKWTNPPDKDLESVCVYAGQSNAFGSAVLLATVSADIYAHFGLVSGTQYWIWLRAKDRSGNLGPVSNSLTVTPTVEASAAARLHFGSSAPLPNTDDPDADPNPAGAAAGDLYVRSNGQIWSAGAGAVWFYTGNDLTGAGESLFTVSTAAPPGANVGENGDVAISLLTGSVWEKIGGQWIKEGDLTGVAGPAATGREWIYRRTATEAVPVNPVSTTVQRETDGYVPAGWVVKKAGPTADLPFEWENSRVGVIGDWGQFLGPALVSQYPGSQLSKGSPLRPALSVEAVGIARAGYTYRVDIGFAGGVNDDGVSRCQLQWSTSSAFSNPVQLDLPRPPISNEYYLHGFLRVYFRARVFNKAGNVWSPWSLAADNLGTFFSEDAGIPSAVRDFSVSPGEAGGTVKVRFREPLNNSRTIWAYEVQARTVNSFQDNVASTLGVHFVPQLGGPGYLGQLGQTSVGGVYVPGSSAFRVPGRNWVVDQWAGNILYILSGLNVVQGTVLYPSSYPIRSNTADTLTLDTVETYGLPNYPVPAGGFNFVITDGWVDTETSGSFLALLKRAELVSNIPQGAIHPDSQWFEFVYNVSVETFWRVRPKNVHGFGPWNYYR